MLAFANARPKVATCFSSENLVLTKSMPKRLSCVHFYNDSWNEDDKYGVRFSLNAWTDFLNL